MKPFFTCPQGVIYCGDLRDVLPQLPKELAPSLVVTSPPYGTLRKYNGIPAFNADETAKAIGDVLPTGGVVVWVVGDQTIKGDEQMIPFSHAYAFKDNGFILYDTMIWEKPSPSVPTEGRYYDVFEYMFVFSKGCSPAVFNPLEDRVNTSAGSKSRKETRSCREDRRYKNETRTVKPMGRRFNVWHISRGNNKTPHPAVFPEALAYDHILTWSNPNDCVLDPMGGSGTTAVAALRAGRKFIYADISEDYCAIARDRIQQELARSRTVN